MLDKPRINGIPSDEQERYKPVTKCTYWQVLGSFNNWNMIQLSQKSTPSDTFDEIHQVVLDGIRDNIALLVKPGKYGAINTTETATNGFYVIILKSEAYTLQHNTTIYGQIITAGELVIKAQYLCSMQVATNWYWNQHPQKHVIKHAQYFIYDLKLIQYQIFTKYPKVYVPGHKKKKATQRQPILLTDYDYDYILEELVVKTKFILKEM